MNRVCLVILIGLPAAGKTTFCHYLMQMEAVPFNILHLCYDNLVNFNSKNPTQYKEQRQHLLKSLKEFVLQFKKFTSLPNELKTMKLEYKNKQHNDIIILCDDNHYYCSMRYKLFQLARENSIGYCQIYFNCDLKLCIERNSLRSGPTKVPNDVIVQMYNRFEYPKMSEHEWEKDTLILQNFNVYENNFNEIVPYILQHLDKPVYSLQVFVSSSAPPPSKAHELDLLMRKRIKTLMNSTQEQNKTLLATNLNAKRKEALKIFQKDNGNKLLADLDLNKYVEMLTI